MRPVTTALPVLLLVTGCTPERDQRASPGGGEDAAAGADATSPDAGDASAEDAADVASADAGHVGCARWYYSHHYGCLPIDTNVSGECHPSLRLPVAGGLAIEGLDELAPWRSQPGRRGASKRSFLVSGTAEVIAPGRLEVQEVGGEGRRLVLDPGLPDGEVLLVNNGAEVEIEYLAHTHRILDPRTEEVLREDASFLLRISEADGALVYALGDPFVPARPVDETLERLGLRVEPAAEPECGYQDYEGMMTPVGWCLIYRRNAAWDVFVPGGASVGVTSGETETLEVDGRIYRVESGDTYLVEDSHDDCNVPPRTELRIVRTG